MQISVGECWFPTSHLPEYLAQKYVAHATELHTTERGIPLALKLSNIAEELRR